MPVDTQIDREVVESSNIRSVGYSAARSTLAIEFKNGTVVHYAGVNLEVATEFYSAESKGGFFAHQIKGKFAGEKMTGPCSRCGAKGLIGDACRTGDGGKHAREDRQHEPPPDLEVAR